MTVIDDLFDQLITDGGWLSTEILMTLTEASHNTVSQSLYRLKARGLVEDRVIRLNNLDRRREWRAVT